MYLLSRLLVLMIVCFTSFASFAQPRTDTSRNNSGPRSTAGPKSFKDLITAKAVTDEGFFSVYKLDDKYYFEIPDSLLGRDILVVNRIAKAAAGMRSGFFGYAGDEAGRNVIRFEKGPNNKIFLRTVSFAEYSKDSTSPMYTAVNNSNVQPIAASFEIKAFSKDSSGSVVDMTDYIGGDNDVLFFNSQVKSALRIGSQQSDKSYIIGVRAYPINIEISTVKTYGRSGGGLPGSGTFTPPGGNLTVEMNSSFVMLPKVPMPSRNYDPRVGYFSVGYTDFDANPQGVETALLIKRWRLEPKDEDMEKYKRGELVEPKKPIIFYIDPATPKVWVPYLIQGVNDWQGAFERAGFKNAIFGKMAPTKEEDPEWSLEDARNSAIVYKPSDVANAQGPSISDPRSGEIMESHINWFHNVMELIHHWYFIQCSPLDPDARKMIYDNDLMGQLVRFVSSHEVGHTLGLRHNYGASSSVPVEKLRDKAWVEANGHTPSIMDYARFNYVAQPEDKIGRKGLFPRIGDYDLWAIEWGYRLFPEIKNAEDEKSHLNKWVIEKLKDNRLWFGTETNADDPRSQREQVGDDGVKGALYGIKNLQRIVPHLEEWTRQPNRDYSSLREMYTQLTNQFSMYISHVSKYVGGIMETPKTVEQQGPVYEIVTKAKQKEAVEFLNRQLFTTPTWILNNDIFDKTGINAISTVGSLQDNALNRMLSTRNLSKLIDAEAEHGSDAYSLTDLLTDLKKGVWSELPGKNRIEVYRRNLQKSYVGILTNLLDHGSTGSGSGVITITLGGGSSASAENSDIRSVVRAHLAALRNEVKVAAAGMSDPMSRYHLQDIMVRIANALDPKN